jgi:hypothetical protein
VGGRSIGGMVDRPVEGLEVPLRGFCHRARGAVAVACDMPPGQGRKRR